MKIITWNYGDKHINAAGELEQLFLRIRDLNQEDSLGKIFNILHEDYQHFIPTKIIPDY